MVYRLYHNRTVFLITLYGRIKRSAIGEKMFIKNPGVHFEFSYM